MLGGRTNHWGRHRAPYGTYDFKPRSRDGLGIDAYTYEDLASYYDKVEALIGVYGSNEGFGNTPDSRGILLPPPNRRAYESLIKKGSARLNIPSSRASAILTQALDHQKVSNMLHPNKPEAAKLRPNRCRRAFVFVGDACGRGCAIKAIINQPRAFWPPRLRVGILAHSYRRDGARGDPWQGRQSNRSPFMSTKIRKGNAG